MKVYVRVCEKAVRLDAWKVYLMVDMTAVYLAYMKVVCSVEKWVD